MSSECGWPGAVRAGAVLGSVAALLIASAIAEAGEGDDTRVARQLAGSCSGCHGTDGRGRDAMPVLAGISKDYFLAQMQAFVSGERQATVMHQLAKGYSTEQLELLASYFSNQRPARVE